ncbi:Hypothetical predicted protein [Xyrichtys novacula]|uniref:Uncharacterized protein n=1 Tax=Xyrichtys novacula TaxID=13765 RepID=A0AAV1FE47_XYRNO|nr:Hypothetical predicted protein [Xyrichtys novacula]
MRESEEQEEEEEEEEEELLRVTLLFPVCTILLENYRERVRRAQTPDCHEEPANNAPPLSHAAVFNRICKMLACQQVAHE